MRLLLFSVFSSCLLAQIPFPGGSGGSGGSGGGTGTANPTHTFTAGATSVTITYPVTLANAAIATDASCTYSATGQTFEYDHVIKSTTNSIVTFLAADADGSCTVNLSGGGGGAGGTGTVTNLTGQLAVDYPVCGAGGNDSKTCGAPRGTGTKVQMTIGSVATDDCAKFDASGNLVSAGAACGTGSGGGGGGGGTIYVGAGITGAGTLASPLILDSTVVPTRLSATASLTFGSTAANACNEQSLTLTGAVTGDEIQVGAPSNIDQGFLWSAYVSIADTVKVRLCKITTGTVTPVVGVWRATITRSF